MSLSIPEQPQVPFWGNRSAAGLSNLKTGDVLEARIIEIETSGRTVFQFAAFRAVAEKPVAGAQIGDVVQFAVVPDETDTAGIQQNHRPSARLALFTTAPREAGPGPSNQSPLRLMTFPGKDLSAAPGKTSAQATPPGTPPSPTGPPAALPLNVLLTSSLQVLSAWIQRFTKKQSLSERSEGRINSGLRNPSETPLEHVSTRASARLEKDDLKPLDRTGEPWGNDFTAGFQLGQRPAKMKMQWRSAGKAEGDAMGLLTAVFLLNLEGSGAVRVDVKMGADTIQVGFWVENEAGRRRLTEALPELSAALASLAGRCAFQVAVSPGRILDFEGGEGLSPEHARLDVRA